MAPKVKLTDPTDDDESIKTYTQDQVNELLEKTIDKGAEAAVQKMLSATAGKADRDEFGKTLAWYNDPRKLPKPPGGTLFMSPGRQSQLPQTVEEDIVCLLIPFLFPV